MLQKCLDYTAPAYLTNRIQTKEHRGLTRKCVMNSETIMFEEPFNKCRTFGD